MEGPAGGPGHLGVRRRGPPSFNVNADFHLEPTSPGLQDAHTHKITDFFSFYTLPSTIIGNAKHSTLEAAYLFYYATDVAFIDGAEEDGRLRKRLQELVGDALIVADQVRAIIVPSDPPSV